MACAYLLLFCFCRWVSFWDIPTGTCDQRNNKEKKVGMFYRPAYCGENCEGHNTCLEMEPHHKFIAVGAEDGYMMVYEVKVGDGPKTVFSGLPPNNRKPATKHPTKVKYVDKLFLESLYVFL